MNGFYDYQAYSNNPQRGGLEAMLSSMFQTAHLGGMGGGGAMTSMGMVEYNMRMSNSRALLESINRNDIRSSAISSRVIDSIAGAGEAARLNATRGMGYVNTLTGTLLNNHNLGIGGYFGGYLSSASAGYQTAVGMGGVTLDGRAVMGQGSTNANITSRLVTDMQNRMFTANGTISKSGFSYDEMGAMISKIGEGGGFKGSQFKSYFHGGTGMQTIDEKSITDFNDKFVEPTAKAMQALKDVFGPGSSFEDLASVMKSLTGLNVGNSGAASLLSSRTTGLRLAAAGAGLDERHVMGMQNQMMAHYKAQGYSDYNSSAAGTYVATQVAGALGASGRVDLQGDFQRQAGAVAGMAFSKGGQYDMLALATHAVRTGAGGAGITAAAKAFLDDTRQNGYAAYQTRAGTGLFTDLQSIADSNGGLDSIKQQMGADAKGDLDTLINGSIGGHAKSIFANARKNFKLGSLEGSRADIQNLIEAVGAAGFANVLSGTDTLADFAPDEQKRLGQVAERLRKSTSGMIAEDLTSVVMNYEKAGGFALSGNTRSKVASTKLQIAKLAAVIPGDVARTSLQQFVAGVLGDNAMSEDEAINALAFAHGEGKGSGLLTEFNFSTLSDEEKLAQLQKLSKDGYKVTNKVVRDANGQFVPVENEYLAIKGDRLKNIQGHADSLKLVGHLKTMGVKGLDVGSILGKLAEGGRTNLASYLTAANLNATSVNKDNAAAFKALLSEMDPTERQKLQSSLEDTTVVVGGKSMNAFEAAALDGMSTRDIRTRFGDNVNVAQMTDDAANNSDVRKAKLLNETKSGGSFLGTLRIENGFNILIDLVKKAADEKTATPGATGSNTKP